MSGLSVTVLLQRNYWCFFWHLRTHHVPYILPILAFLTVSSPILSMLLEPTLFPWESLVPSFLPDSSEPARPESGTLLIQMMPFIYGQDQIPLLSSSLSPPGQLGLRGSAHCSGLSLCTLLVWQRCKPAFPSKAGGHALLFSVPWSEDLYMPTPWPYSLQTLVTF